MTSDPPAQDAAAAGQVPVCPRHPGRESYVRCQRCERPVCPECQRSAAVGVQCVDCVREQNRGARRARTAFGGRAGDQPPRVTQSLVALCVVAFMLQLVLGNGFTDRFDFIPPYALSQPWRALTSAFLHSPTFLLHILFNMYALWLIGPYLESLLGHARFAALYLLSAVGGSVGFLVLADPVAAPGSSWFSATVGASGAIFGLFAALLLVNRRLGRDSAGIIGLIVINGVLGFVPHLNIAWQAHLGGFVTGGLVAAVLVYSPAPRRRVFHLAGLVAVAVLLVGVTLAKAATVPVGLLL